MSKIATILLKIPGRQGIDVVVAGVIGEILGLEGQNMHLTAFLTCEKPCYNCYNLLIISIKVKIVKGYKVLQGSEKCQSLLQVVTNLLQVVTKVCNILLQVANYWHSVIYKVCNKCYKCNRKKLDHT